jgi:hypothetical protein
VSNWQTGFSLKIDVFRKLAEINQQTLEEFEREVSPQPK